METYAPPLRAVSSFFTGVKRVWNDYVFLFHVQRENRELKKSLDLLTEKTVQMKELELENERLRQLLSLKERSSAKLVSAEIIARDAIGFRCVRRQPARAKQQRTGGAGDTDR